MSGTWPAWLPADGSQGVIHDRPGGGECTYLAIRVCNKCGWSGGGRSLITLSMPERGRGGLDEKVREILADLPVPVLAYHTYDSRKSPAGFPDWVICGRAGVLYRELKREGEDPTPRQQEWLDGLTAAGQDADVWRPADQVSGRIAREIAAVAGLHITGLPAGTGGRTA